MDIKSLTERQRKTLAADLLTVMEEEELDDVLSKTKKIISPSSAARICSVLMDKLHDSEIEEVLDQMFSELARRQGIESTSSFIQLSLIAMKKLKAAGKHNLVFLFPRSIALCRPNSEDALMPINRMPFGLIEYQIQFFNAHNVNEVCIIPVFQYFC